MMKPSQSTHGRIARLALPAVAALIWSTLASSLWAVDHSKPAGEPYALAGKRLVFTNWTYVRTGQWDWTDEKGQSLFALAADAARKGPWDAHFRTYLAPRGVRLVTEPAQRSDKPIIEPSRPWEAMGIGVGTLIHDEGKYRLWGWCQDAAGVTRPCYFESTDGADWSRPNLGLVEVDGRRENNLIVGMFGQLEKELNPKPNSRLMHFSVFKDPNPAAPPAERYKSAREGKVDLAYVNSVKDKRAYSLMAVEGDPGEAHVIIGSVSPDGLRWTDLKEPLSIETSDTSITIDYNARAGKYVLYTRSHTMGARADGQPFPPERMHGFVTRRSIGRGESPDFHRFPPSDVIVEPGSDFAPSETIYTNCKTTIPGAPDHHVMFPAIYDQNVDSTSIAFYTSLDTRVWHKAPGGAVLKTADFGAFDGGCIFAYPNLVELPGGDWVLPYTGCLYPHKFPRGAWRNAAGLARWPKGRLAALEAPEQGEFWTVGFMPPGRTIRINAVTARAGSIRVEVCDFAGKPVSGRTLADARPVIGDQYRTPLKWEDHTDIGSEEGKPVILHFVLDHARIYGIDFE